MSKSFAVIENEKVVNTIIADTLEIAIEVTGNKQCVEILQGVLAVPGWSYKDSMFTEPSADLP